MTQKLFFVSIITLICFIGIIIHKLKMYTQDYLILYEASIGEKEIKMLSNKPGPRLMK